MYKHLSGAQKRKKKRDAEKGKEKQKLIHSFLHPQSQEVPGTSSMVTESHLDDVEEGTSESIQTQSNQDDAGQGTSIQKHPSYTEDIHHLEISEPIFSDDAGDLPTDNIQDRIISYSHDPAEWRSDVSEGLREYISQNIIKNTCTNFSASRRMNAGVTRYLSPDLFLRKRKDDKAVPRDWLIYSESTGNVFCVPCKLYGPSSYALTSSGFSDWKNANARIMEHENSIEHRASVFKFMQRAKSSCRIDHALVTQAANEQKYWREVLRRVVAVVKFLGERGLPFRGNDEMFGSPQNGVFLGCLELIAQFDPFLHDHIQKYGGSGRGVSNYMSSTTVNEFIELMGGKVVDTIVKELDDAKYFSVIVDSTPDLSHIDQLTIIIRYVNKDVPVERFLGFVPIHSHTGEHLESTLLTVLADKKIDIQHCRGQSYDNASNMSGKYNGLQARIRNLNPLADYVPCSAHSLNLVGTCAAECCLNAVSFFNFLEKIYTFFSGSTHRWEILKNQLNKASGNLSLKHLSSTRWAARSDATKALRRGFPQVNEALDELRISGNQASVRHEASALSDHLNKFETVIMLVVWGNILDRLHATSKSLQSTQICLNEVVILYRSLIDYVQKMRDSFDTWEAEAKELTSDQVYSAEKKRERKSKTFHDDPKTAEQRFTPREKFIFGTFNVIIDSLLVHLRKRNEAYELLNKRFEILNNEPPLSLEDLRISADNLKQHYQNDLEDTFTEEFIQFSSLTSQESLKSPMAMLQFIITHDLQQTFPNVETMLRVFLCMPVANASGERSFSCLKRIKNERRTTMGQDRLSALSLLAVESDLVRQLNFDDIVDTFAKAKSRKVKM
ncbi:hypothetical protein GDO86_003726 [Hymenochirus boettgeri]|uniref:TTF-type domain-containing protein n=1 Tax=Hymenochirus boettgeri TaxID=247094 RepID=A0A8T2K2T7_9PIPI|nr:hypothetical protein GDO86_003726 [Hymenochirus boettgeri]